MTADDPVHSDGRFSPLDTGGAGERESAAIPGGNQLLAGYLAHEFLTRGTLFGRRFRTGEARPAKKPRTEIRQGQAPAPALEKDGETRKAYAELARVLREEGEHLPGIVNPWQLAEYLQSVQLRQMKSV